MSDAGPALFRPLTIRSVRFRNRLWASPMCQYAVERRDGVPGSWHLIHLGPIARGGSGLVMTEATAIAPNGRISAYDTGLWNDEQTAAWADIVEFVHSQGAAAGIQLSHAGMKGSVGRPWDTDRGRIAVADGGWLTPAASLPADGDSTAYPVLTHDGIQELVGQFVAAARRAVDAGFDVIELHGAHGYLLHQFLSPVTNARTDGYGGDLAGRARMLLETVRAVRADVGPEVAVFVRLSAVDWIEGGLEVEDCSRVTRLLADNGADLFDISTGGLQTVRIKVWPGYQVDYAAAVREATGCLVSAVGLITEPEQANVIVAEGRADAVMVARELLRDPHFVARAANALGINVPDWPVHYAWAKWHPVS